MIIAAEKNALKRAVEQLEKTEALNAEFLH